jgi:hypothetical protein
VWLKDGRSTLDLFGRGFTLMRIGAEPPPVDAFVAAAAKAKMPLLSSRPSHNITSFTIRAACRCRDFTL